MSYKRKEDYIKWVLNNKDKIKKYNRDYKERDKERYRDMHKKWKDSNREKIIGYKRKAYEQNKNNILFKESTAKAKRKYRYGITREQFEQMKIAQNNKCAICGTEFIKTPSIDHNHLTGKVRQLLCQHCNCGIGYLKENTFIILNAYNYIKKWEAI